MKGKAFANRKKKKDRPKGDFYSTPKSLVWVVKDIIKIEFNHHLNILEPCCGKLAISEELKGYKYTVINNDLYSYNKFVYKSDYLKIDTKTVGMSFNKQVITNPPFSLWDEFVLKAKTHCKKFMFIGRLNYFGTYGRHEKGLWNNLKAVFPFNRYVDYRTPYREDGLFHVGSQATAWFLWDMDYVGLPIMKVLDVQKYAKLGAYKDE